MTRTAFALLTLLLLITTIFFGWRFWFTAQELEQAKADLQAEKLNTQTLAFASLFIDKILRARGEVDFETRLELENQVRNLKNPIILTEWQKFTNSKTETEAQEGVKNLLEALIKNIKVRG